MDKAQWSSSLHGQLYPLHGPFFLTFACTISSPVGSFFLLLIAGTLGLSTSANCFLPRKASQVHLSPRCGPPRSFLSLVSMVSHLQQAQAFCQLFLTLMHLQHLQANSSFITNVYTQGHPHVSFTDRWSITSNLQTRPVTSSWPARSPRASCLQRLRQTCPYNRPRLKSVPSCTMHRSHLQ